MSEPLNGHPESPATPHGGAPPDPPPRIEVVPPPSAPRHGAPGTPLPQGFAGRKRPRRGLMFYLLLGLCLWLAYWGLSAFQEGAFNLDGAAGGSDGWREQLVSGQGDDKIVLIEVKGVLMDIPGSGFFGGGSSIVRRTQRQLRRAAADPKVKAVLLAVNSPGGGVTASDVLYNEVKKVKAAGKKVVVHMGDVCASGGYYLSAPADAIVASPTTITGSIGVIFMHMDMSELYAKIGLADDPIKSGPHKDINSSSRKMTPAERKIIQSLVDEMYRRFVDIVIAGRSGKGKFPKVRAAVEQIADGRVYTGQQAEKLGLVDKTGYLKDALNEAKRLAGLTQAKVVRYHKEAGLLERLTGQARTDVRINTGVQIQTPSLPWEATPHLEYRWFPGR